MAVQKQSTSSSLWERPRWGTLLALACILGVVAVLFARSFLPGQIVFSNDGPLGVYQSSAMQAPSNFLAVWADLNWVGGNNGGLPPTLSTTLLWLLKPLGYAKFFAAITVVFLGICAWIFFRQLKLHWLACLLGGLAAALNSDLFTTACWGVGTQTICFGAFFLALTAVHLTTARWPWIRFVLAGFAVGIGIMEGFDIGAIFSLAFAAYVLYATLVTEGPIAPKFGWGTARVVVVALFAGFISAQTVTGLINLNIKGVVGTGQDAQSKAERWDFSTMFSLPKRELLSVIVPGLFGFRYDASQRGMPGGDYWGAAGRDPNWDRYFEAVEKGQPAQPPGGSIRFSGGGVYAGVLVVLVAAWAGAQALRKQGSVFSLQTRKLLWFWLGLMLLSVLLAFGRHAPFYQFFYALPYSSTMRNPAKFMHIFSWALVIVFAYGLDALCRRYLGAENGRMVASPAPEPPTGPFSKHLRTWWTRASAFDRKWTRACLAAIGLSLLGWVIYASSRPSLESYLQTVQFGPEAAKAIAGFSIGQVGRYLLFLVLAVGVLTAILSGWCRGRRALWAAGALGLLLLADLGVADRPWVIYWDYPQKYATNPILDQLRQQPYEHRVSRLPDFLMRVVNVPEPLGRAQEFLRGLYIQEWMQHQFRSYDVQSLDIVQMPRMSVEYLAFETAVQPHTLTEVPRRWELTNTRYLLGLAGFLDLLNQGLDPEKHRFQIAARFAIVPKDTTRPTGPEEWMTVPSTNGPLALFEFTGALPRAQLYSQWEVCAQDPALTKAYLTNGLSAEDCKTLSTVGTNDFLTLKELGAPAFDPHQTVLLAETPAVKPAAAAANTPAVGGSVEFLSYAPKRLLLSADVKAPSILLLNDKFDPSWKVWVDGKPEQVLRCNYVMRGVQLAPGKHQVEFRFLPSLTPFYVSLAGIGVAILSLGCVLAFKPAAAAAKEAPAAATAEKS